MSKLILRLQCNSLRIASRAFKEGNSFLFLSAFLIFSLAASAQNKTVTGFVRNEKGEPVSSVSVTVKETSVGTTTDANGKFSISVPQGKKILVFAIVGYL